MNAAFVHDFDAVIVEIAGIETYWYGLGYAAGFVGLHIWLMARRNKLGWSATEVYDVSILFASCVLIGGRLFSVVVYHWDYFATRPEEIIAVWRGGMTSHGLLLGGVVACLIASKWKGWSLRRLLDEVAIPAAFFLALGRLGNFVNGQIVGSVTDMPWGVIFPGFEEPRHPVTLYDAAKNLVMIPILYLVMRSRGMGSGLVAAHFILWYGLLRFIVDLYRDYAGTFLGLGKGQYFNLTMALVGLLLVMYLRHSQSQPAAQSRAAVENADWQLWIRRLVFLAIMCFSLVLRSGWNQDVIKERRSDLSASSYSIALHTSDTPL